VQVLLSATPPATLGLVNDWGLTAVALAQVKGNTEARDALIAAGGTVAGLHTFYPLHVAAVNGDAGDPWCSSGTTGSCACIHITPEAHRLTPVNPALISLAVTKCVACDVRHHPQWLPS
jgi:hypothetical protein